MLFCHHENLNIFLGQLKHSDKAAIQKLRRDWTADVIGKFARAKFNILPRLHGGQLIFSPLCLHRHDVFSAIRVDSDIEFVDLNLPDSLNGRSQVILQRIACDAKKYINDTVVASPREQCLLVR